LGGGGFGKTYLAEDIDRLRTKCVIKQFAPQIQGTPALQKATELFEQEAKQLEQLGKHPQIPGLWAYFEDNSRLYLVQEFIEGENLLAELEKQGTFGEEKIRGLLLDLLPILEVVHQAQVIHRDIKPENIMRRGSDGKLLLIDFGASKQIQGTVKPGTQIGTLGYAALEQMQDRQVYPATDLYSVGATCFHLLTGIHPWDLYIEVAYIWVEQWRQHLKQSISPQLGTIVDKLLQKEYQQRYQSAGEVLQALVGVPPQPVTPTPKNTLNVPLINRLREKVIKVVTVNRAGTVIRQEQQLAQYLTEDLGNGVNLVMAEIHGGSFIMGSPEEEEGSFNKLNEERPQHQVTIQPFYMGKYPITQAQWRAVATLPQVNRKLDPDPSRFFGTGFMGENRPVIYVYWHDAVEFCERLTEYTKKQYRLPSEAEWEYTCRARTTTPFHFGETITTEYANYDGNFTYGSEPKGVRRDETTEVGIFSPNAFGLYDMHGNVWEWCRDTYHRSYEGAPTDGSAWVGGNDDRSSHMMRGGVWNSKPKDCRSAERNYIKEVKKNFVGFRVACAAAGTK